MTFLALKKSQYIQILAVLHKCIPQKFHLTAFKEQMLVQDVSNSIACLFTVV